MAKVKTGAFLKDMNARKGDVYSQHNLKRKRELDARMHARKPNCVRKSLKQYCLLRIAWFVGERFSVLKNKK